MYNNSNIIVKLRYSTTVNVRKGLWDGFLTAAVCDEEKKSAAATTPRCYNGTVVGSLQA